MNPSVRVETVAAFAARRENVLQEARVDLAFEFRDALVIAVVVRIDVDEAIERVAGFFMRPAPRYRSKSAHERIEIFGFAIQFLVEARDRLGDGQGIRIRGGDAVHLGGEFNFLARSAHPFLRLDENRGGFVVLTPART